MTSAVPEKETLEEKLCILQSSTFFGHLFTQNRLTYGVFTVVQTS